MTSQVRHDDLGELSPTVAGALAATPTEVTAAELAQDILASHPDYGGGRATKLHLAGGATDGKRRERRTWLAGVRDLYDRDAAPMLHGRLVIIGLARLEPELRAALDADGFYDALVSELRQPLEALLARSAPPA